MANQEAQPEQEKRSELATEIHGRLVEKLKDAQAFEGDRGRSVAGAGPTEEEKRLGFFTRVTRVDVALLCRQLATLFGVGIPILRALQILGRRSPNRRLGKVVRAIGYEVEQGRALSEAMAKYPRIFGSFIVNTVRAGEEAGTLPETLNMLADYLEKDNRMRRKLRSALSYPLITSLIAVGVIIILLVRVLPQFAEVFKTANVELPLPTRILLAAQNFVLDQGFFLIALVVLAFLLHRVLRQSENWAAIFDAIKVRMPVFGRGIVYRMITFRFARLMSVMMDSGVPVHEALGITANALCNQYVRRRMLEANKRVLEGETIESSLRKNKVFPEIVHDIVAVGEETGSLNIVLGKTAQAYEEELEAIFENLAVLLEPLMLITIGGLVALVALAMFLPYFQMGMVIPNL